MVERGLIGGLDRALKAGTVPRHEDGRRKAPSTDGARSCFAEDFSANETSRKPPPGPEIQAEHDPKNGPGEAAPNGKGPADA